MTNRRAKGLVLAAALGIGFYCHAVTPDSRYNTIVERNVFRLTSPPPPPAAPTNNEALDRNIELSGISNVNGHKKAWFIIKPKAGSKDGPQYVSLGENERQEFLEVQNISEAEGEVKVLNAGNPMILSFKNNGVKVAPGSMPAAAPAPVATAAMATQHPGAPSYAGPQSNYGGRPVTVMGGGTPTTPTGQPADNGLRSIPSRTMRTSVGGQQNSPNSARQPAVDPVTQRALMEIQQEHARQTGQTLPPLPPLPQ